MKALIYSTLAIFLLSVGTLHAENFIGVSGMVTDKMVNQTLPNTKIKILDAAMLEPVSETYSDAAGRFQITLVSNKEYILIAEKPNYFRCEKKVRKEDLLKPVVLEMETKPGYFFDITVFDGDRVKSHLNLVDNARVEIYNNTTGEEVLSIDKNPKAGFNYSFKEENHYTILVRKAGYLNRRIEVYVDIDGCILCIDGMGVEENPNVTDIMLRENQIGYLLGNIALDTIEIGSTFALENIYYDYDKTAIRPDAAKELDKLVEFLRDNPAISVELGAHTDVRGSDSYNLELSKGRAASAVNYIVEEGKVNRGNITSQGYGETQLVNECEDGVPCSEAKHQKNRRTEIKITGYDNSDPLDGATLKQIIEDPNIYEKMLEKRKREKELIKQIKKDKERNSRV